MKRFTEQLQKKASSVTLNKHEAADLRARVVSYMEYHPLPAELRSPAAATRSKQTAASRPPVLREPFSTYQVPFANLFKFGGALAAIILVIVPFVAERAVPGDTLYAIKVNFNEEVRGTLLRDPYQKVEWETARLNRRIAEAKLLEKEGRLTAAAEAEVAAAVRQHADNAKAEIETMRAADADEAAIATIELDSTLALQAEALATPATETATSSGALIASAIGESRAVEAASSTLPSLPKLTARVEQHTTRVRELELALVGQVAEADRAEVTRRIEDIERVAAEALALPAEAATDAQAMLVDVIARAQRLIVFMTELTVRESVALDQVVPVVLTPEEETSERITHTQAIDTAIADLSAVVLPDTAAQAKLAALVSQLVALQTKLADAADHDQFLSDSNAALTLVRDAELLVEQAGAAVAPVVASSTPTTTPAVISTPTTTDATSTEAVDTAAPASTTASSTLDEPAADSV